jgi:hypothetical protein
MNGVNLIPAGRLRLRRAVSRLRRWAIAVPITGTLLVCAYFLGAISLGGASGAAATALAQTHEKIDALKARSGKLGRDNREQNAVLRANRAVGEQPDWGLMLSLLASRLGEDAVLSACTVEPVPPDPSVKTPVKSEAGRPSKLRLTIKGQSRTQEAASRFVIELERTGVFDRVTLVETKRSEPPLEDISFEVLCALSDSGAMSK